VTVLRFANVLGADLNTPLSRKPVPLGLPVAVRYDPLLQFIEQGDVVRRSYTRPCTPMPARSTWAAREGCR